MTGSPVSDSSMTGSRVTGSPVTGSPVTAADRRPCEDWWSTGIIEMEPGLIRFRGYAIEDLIGRLSFPGMIWLLLRGELPTEPEAELLGTALMAAVDHGPQAPSIAIARMAVTCGVGINNAMASAMNVLGDVHGGAGEQCVSAFNAIATRISDGATMDDAIDAELDAMAERGEPYVPGFGHRFHPIDPRAPRLLELVDAAAKTGTVTGNFARTGRAIETRLAARKGKTVPMNIDGATAVIFAELGFPPPLCRGLFVLSRSVGTLAHAWEQMQQGERNKGPIPREYTWTYTGPAQREMAPDSNGR